jgi:drug/metabolite transporter (DMT)-like permease
VHGSGPTVLMHTMAIYSGLAPESVAIKTELDHALVASLADRYRLVLVEYPGRPKPRSLTPANVVADLLYLLATRHGLLSLVVVITSMYPAATVILARSILREPMDMQQVIGLLLAAASVVLIALG